MHSSSSSPTASPEVHRSPPPPQVFRLLVLLVLLLLLLPVGVLPLCREDAPLVSEVEAADHHPRQGLLRDILYSFREAGIDWAMARAGGGIGVSERTIE